MKFKKILSFLINLIILLSLFYCLSFLNTSNINKYVKLVLLIIGFILYLLSFILKTTKFTKLYKLSYLLFIVFAIIVDVYIILNSLGVFNTFSSVTALKEYILSTKELGVIIYILIQTAQVVIMPIPAAVICIVGSLIYGPFLGAIYCTIGILIGSYVSYFIGKIFGHKLVSWIAGEENVNKYSEIIRSRGKVFLCLAFLLPMFPDDILCLIAGITDMNFSSFFWITLITRPIGVICMSYFGSGSLIPFAGWGIYVWIIILIIAISIAIIISKYQQQMQNFVLRKVLKKKY